MGQYQLTEAEYKQFDDIIVKTQLLPSVAKQVCDFVPMPFKFKTSFPTVSDINMDDFQTWSLAPHAIDDSANVLFGETENDVYRLQRTFRIENARLKVSRTSGQPLDTTLIQQIIRKLDKELEAYVFQGPKINGNRLTTQGLFNKAGNTSTYSTVKFASAAGPYNTVNDMVGLLEADGFTGPYILVTDTTLSPYFRYLPATDANFTEVKRIKENLNISAVLVSDQLPAATSNDGVLLLVQKDAINYRVKTPQGLARSGPMVYFPGPDAFYGRVEGFYTMEVLQANAICKHVSVDLA